VDKGKIFVVSAPSGTGKTTIVRRLMNEMPSLVFSVSATTRQKRDSEVDGKDYFFLTEEEFMSRIDNDEFAEWEKVYDYYYGTFRYFIEET
jgi:guanylate kinase